MIIFLNSCCQIFGTKYEYNENGGLRAKKQSFYKYKGDEVGDLSGLRFDGIYIRRHLGVNIFPDEQGFAYFRFFKSGHVHLSFLMDDYPTIDVINNLKSGIGGYFKVRNGIVKTEHIIERDCGTRVLEFGKIAEDRIEIYAQNPRTFYGYIPKNSRRVNWMFVKFENLSDEIPNW